jgi:hypothetical protein
MDALTFLAEITKALAWPVTAVVLAVLFRSELRALLSRLKKGKVGSAEFEFKEEVEELAKDIAEVSPQAKPVALKPETVNLATLNPRAAMLTAWIEIEVALTKLAEKHGLLSPQMRRNPTNLVRNLARAELIPKAYAPGFIALYRLRNQAAHEMDFNPPEDAILGYLEIAEELKQLVVQDENAR